MMDDRRVSDSSLLVTLKAKELSTNSRIYKKDQVKLS